MVYSCMLCGSWAVAVCPGVRGPCPFVSMSIASHSPRTSCFPLATLCGINALERPVPFPHRLLHAVSASGGWAMTFEEILDQAMAMLQRRRRVAYRTLQVQFHLDDNALEALKDELLYAQQVARDEDGRVLVWTGGPETLPSPPPPSTTHASQSPPPEMPLPQTAPGPVTPSTPDAERRQLTVMFCDLVESTKLSGQLDPEEYREVVRAYQRVCTEVIQRYDGHIAQYLGDGLLIYFGFPVAHEDDAQRAVRTSLGILAAMGDLNTRLQQAKGIQLAIRVGVHTGLVVVGEMGGQGRQEQLALGETPNIAARIQGLAQSDTIIISADTHRLIQ